MCGFKLYIEVLINPLKCFVDNRGDKSSCSTGLRSHHSITNCVHSRLMLSISTQVHATQVWPHLHCVCVCVCVCVCLCVCVCVSVLVGNPMLNVGVEGICNTDTAKASSLTGRTIGTADRPSLTSALTAYLHPLPPLSAAIRSSTNPEATTHTRCSPSEPRKCVCVRRGRGGRRCKRQGWWGAGKLNLRLSVAETTRRLSGKLKLWRTTPRTRRVAAKAVVAVGGRRGRMMTLGPAGWRTLAPWTTWGTLWWRRPSSSSSVMVFHRWWDSGHPSKVSSSGRVFAWVPSAFYSMQFIPLHIILCTTFPLLDYTRNSQSRTI